MKLQYLPLLGIVLLMNACMWGVPKSKSPSIAQDTLTYKYDTIKERASDCGTKPDSGCTIAKITYPFFDKRPTINDSVIYKLDLFLEPAKSSPLLNYLIFSDFKSDTNLKQIASQFMSIYKKDKLKGNLDNSIYNMDLHSKIIRQDSSILTLEFDEYIFLGGAHGISSTYFINWNTKTNKPIYLADILSNGYQTKLTAIADSIFRKSENLSDSTSLKTNYFFKNGVFSLNNNYLITPLGIRFLYNEYEIKPYAAGQTNLLIPYAKIKLLLLPHTVVSQYLK